MAIFRLWRQRRVASERAQAEADALIKRFGNAAYEEARSRARDAQHSIVRDQTREKHWRRVRQLIARQTGRSRKLDTATRYLEK